MGLAEMAGEVLGFFAGVGAQSAGQHLQMEEMGS